jgi:5-methylthioadenosine/S-adenosylhomocysteine deaminase
MAINNKNKKGSSFIYDIIIRNTNLASMCADRPQIEKSVDIAIKDGKIAKIASIIPHNAIKEIDGTQKLVTPGFINLHSHVCMSVFRFTNQNYSTVE